MNEQQIQRKYVDQTIGSIANAIDVSLMDEAVKRGVQDNEPEFDFYSFVDRNNINVVTLQEKYPWVNTHNYFREILSLNSSQVWKHMFQGLEDKEVKAVSDFTRMFRVHTLNDLATRVVLSNQVFVERALSSISLAALTGREFNHYMLGIPKWSTSIPAAESIAHLFDTPALDIVELYSRTQMLFPSFSSSSDMAAINQLVKNNAFEISVGTNVLHCPAVNLTRKLFTSYGNLLNSQEYRDVFTNRVSAS